MTTQGDLERAKVYEERLVPAMLQQWATQLVEFAGVRPGDSVLDVACGTGVVARAAMVNGSAASARGCDISSGMLEEARHAAPDIPWDRCDASDLPYEDGSFDRVLCQAALMFFADQASALWEMGRVTAPGGSVAVQVWGASPGYELLGEVLREEAGAEAAGSFLSPFGLRDRGRVEDLFAEAGLHVTASETRTHIARFDSVQAFVELEVEGDPMIGAPDSERLASAVFERLSPFVKDDGHLEIPMDGHLVRSDLHAEPHNGH